MKRILALILCMFLLVPIIASATTTQAPTTSTDIVFTDVDATSIQGKAIYKLVKNNIVLGYGDGTFKPNGYVTRAELVKMVNLVFKYTKSDTVNFSDVKKEDWFYPYTLVAKQAGYITGYEDGTFRGANNLSRQEACVIISRVGGLYDLPFMANISDEVADWALPYVRKVLANTFMSLEEGNKFRATENITRGELALVLSKFIVEAPVITVTPTVPANQNSSSSTSSSSSSNNDKDEDDEEESEISKKINKMLYYIKKVRFETTYERPIMNVIKATLEKVIADEKKGKDICANNYVKNTYHDDIELAKSMYQALDETRKSNFESRLLTNFPTETVDELLDIFFDKRLADFIK